ncbi:MULTISPECIES: ABC transporter ATP-binding protein [unclassified Sporosarcina]|uniref:ABC transporter ATP-binding protein n=1 Tax=unclassified Sporosarcina TaxID=2647733 RepID=UPI00203AC94F|nr:MULTISPECIES: ABC transporter transmembrane domain-containing protein [unclassified Sporosarcina]GKV64523.1 multidrug ABC transporter permease/ATP-binding protein [Sporosarcina sp. NCCP-2331]GLB54604.1 multidrug ABC transporter permease/ATP-binding protein [Sporosarcina sp. NCCP-2378]
MKVLVDLGWFFKERKKQYIIGVTALMLVAVLQLAPPKIIGMIVDAVAEGTLTAGMLKRWMIILAAAGVLMYMGRYLWRVMIFGSAVYLARTMRERLFQHFTRMSPSFYQRRRVGDLMAHATNDISAVQQTAGMGILTLADSVSTGGFVILTMALTISWKLTLIALIPIPFMVILTSYYGRLLRRRFMVAQEAFSDLNDKTQESISGIKVLKTFGQQKKDIKAFTERSEKVVQKNMRVAKIDALFDPTIALIFAVSYILAFVFGTRFIIAGDLKIGELIAFISYLGLLTWPMFAIGFLFNIVERGNASYSRIQDLLSVEQEIQDRPGAVDELPQGDIVFDIGTFTFPDDTESALRDIHFTLKQGETLGIVGRTGSGKTAILKLLMREFEGYTGSITYGGIPITRYKKESLRQAIGYVPQDHFLFSTTLGENIAFTNPAIDQQEIVAAAKAAHIHEDILAFADGYETMVGERGVSLSGGQRQRISIARALLMNPELLLLDDSLSAVDARTEEAILHSLKEQRTGKTTVITSHRLSAIQHAHQIIVMEEGKVAEIGDHQSLLKKQGIYKEMYELQQLESIVEQGGETYE